jgi:hypothetical protein
VRAATACPLRCPLMELHEPIMVVVSMTGASVVDSSFANIPFVASKAWVCGIEPSRNFPRIRLVSRLRAATASIDLLCLSTICTSQSHSTRNVLPHDRTRQTKVGSNVVVSMFETLILDSAPRVSLLKISESSVGTIPLIPSVAWGCDIEPSRNFSSIRLSRRLNAASAWGASLCLRAICSSRALSYWHV